MGASTGYDAAMARRIRAGSSFVAILTQARTSANGLEGLTLGAGRRPGRLPVQCASALAWPVW